MITFLIAVAVAVVTAYGTWRLCKARQVLDAILQDARTAPDPGEVEELTELLAGLCMRAVQPSSEELARAALRWFRDRQQRGDGRDG